MAVSPGAAWALSRDWRISAAAMVNNAARKKKDFDVLFTVSLRHTAIGLTSGGLDRESFRLVPDPRSVSLRDVAAREFLSRARVTCPQEWAHGSLEGCSTMRCMAKSRRQFLNRASI